MPKVKTKQPIVMRIDGKYTELPTGSVVDVTDGVCASLVNLGQAELFVPAPEPLPPVDRKGGRK